MIMNKYKLQNPGVVMFSELWRMFIVFMLVMTVDAWLQKNNAELEVSCDDSAMNVRMTFKYPFSGIVFIPEHYYDPTCSYGVSPNTTALQITLTLPHDSCKMRVLNNKLIGFNTIVVFHHRMLETVYDYSQNVTCDLKHPIKDLNKNIWHEPRLKTWISFENSPSILPEHFVDKMGLGDALLLVYHVKDKGVNRDMVVMNCIGHDASTIDEKTRFYQLSNPFGCSSESDLVSNFTVFRNSIGDANMLAYAIIRNFSMVVRRRLYITCGAQLCKDRCERQCGGIEQQQHLYFSDIVTKGLVNRPEGSKRPTSLTAFERFDRQRRSHITSELFHPHNATDEQKEYLLEKMNAVSSYPVIQFGTGENQTSTKMNQNDTTTLLPDSEEHIRFKRAIKELKSELISSGLNVIVIKSDKTVDLNEVSLQSASENKAENSVAKNSSDLCQNSSVTKVKMLFEPQHSSRIDGGGKSENFNFNSFLRALVAIFALICISGACYSLFSFRSQLDTVSVSDYASQSYI